MAGWASQGSLRGPALRAPSRGGGALIERNYVVLPETPEAVKGLLVPPLQPVNSVGSPARPLYSSFTSGDFSHLGGPSSGGPLNGLMCSMFARFPLWCESLFWWLLPVLLFAFLFLLYSAGTLLLPRSPREDYGIVVDAGSHGSRVNIFKWTARVYDSHNPLTGPVSLPRLSDFRVYEPGLEEAFEHPEEGRAQLQQMIRDASASLAASGVQAARWGEIPIYFKATAGMRIVGQERRDRVMQMVRDTLRDKNANPFHFRSDFARVISGEEEGVYGWVAVNSEKNLLGAPPEQTVGALDMGGSSIQITFSPFFTSILEDFNSVHLGNTSLRVYSHSYLGYGWADALTRVNLKLAAAAVASSAGAPLLPLQQAAGSRLASRFMKTASEAQRDGRRRRLLLLANPVPHPCFPKGHSFAFTLPPISQEGLRLYVDLSAQTLQLLLQHMGVPKRARDRIAAAAEPGAVKARHELQDAEGREEARKRQRRGAPFTTRDSGEHTDAQGGAPLGASDDQRGQAKEGVLLASSPEAPAAGKGAKAAGGGAPAPAVFGEGARMQKVNVRFTGVGDFGACHKVAAELFFNFPCFINRCSFNGVYQPRLMDSKFQAFGQYAKVWSALQLPPTPSLSAWREKTEGICSMDSEALAVYRHENGVTSYSDKGMRRVCWKATWSYALLADGFGFDRAAHQITFSAPREEKTAAGEGPPRGSEAPGAPGATGWALGSMLIDVNLYPWGTPDRSEFYLYILGAVSVGLFACLVSVLHLLRRSQAALRCLETEAAFAFQSANFQSAPDIGPASP
ncbi:hypothetical protein Efla_004499 [Eimeria flavescens]